MSKIFGRWLLAFIAVSLCFAQTPAAASGQLTTAQWLRDNLNRPDLLIIDASPGKLHAAGHIPGAVNVDVFTYGARDMSAAEKEKQIQSWGIDSNKTVVIYDQGGTYLATSLLFDLYYNGFPRDRLVVLDGGFAKWQAAGGAVTKEPTPKPAPGTFRVTTERKRACEPTCRNSSRRAVTLRTAPSSRR